MVSKAEAQILASEASQVGGRTLRGPVKKESGDLFVGKVSLSSWLSEHEGREVILIVLPLEEPGNTKQVCRTCGREYTGLECPHCREARRRLRRG